jgi:hypothetical protein
VPELLDLRSGGDGLEATGLEPHRHRRRRRDSRAGARRGVTALGQRFAAVAATASPFATQLRPERSGDAGLQIYENLVSAVASA